MAQKQVVQTSQSRVVLLWFLLWGLTGFIIEIRNSIILKDFDLGKIVFLSVIIDIPILIGSAVVFGITWLIYKMALPDRKISLGVTIAIWFIMTVLLITFRSWGVK